VLQQSQLNGGVPKKLIPVPPGFLRSGGLLILERYLDDEEILSERIKILERQLHTSDLNQLDQVSLSKEPNHNLFETLSTKVRNSSPIPLNAN
jgi:hypothetical protein